MIPYKIINKSGSVYENTYTRDDSEHYIFQNVNNKRDIIWLSLQEIREDYTELSYPKLYKEETGKEYDLRDSVCETWYISKRMEMEGY